MDKGTRPVRFQDLITKFYYKQNHLCFQIILNVGNDKTVPYKEFTDYEEYKAVFNKLMKMKATKKAVPVEGANASKSSVVYV